MPDDIGVSLVKIELHAITERAFEYLEIHNEEACKNSFESGKLFYRLSLMANLTPYERGIAEGVKLLFADSPFFSGGYETAADEYLHEMLEVAYDPNIERRESEKAYQAELEAKVRECAVALNPYLLFLEGISSYEDLLKIDKGILALLVAFERAKVSSNEAYDEYLDSRTSGHHRDRLEIYRNALEGNQKLEGCFVYVYGDGVLDFSPVADVTYCR